MGTLKLTGTKGFVITDLDDAPRSVGVVRSAPSVLQSSALNMARSVTYTFAAFEVQAGGASAGISAKADERPAALEAFVNEVSPRTEGGALVLDPAKGVTEEDLAGLRANDPRPAWLYEPGPEGISGSDQLTAASALAAADAVDAAVDGSAVVIEGFGPVGLAIARAVVERGGTVVAVATAAGTAVDPGGLDPAALGEAWAGSGDGFVKAIGAEAEPAWAAFGVEADVLFVGSKPGVLTHEGADHVKARAVVPVGPVPLTTKAMLQLQRRGVAVVPDFLALAGAHLAGAGLAGDSLEAAGPAVSDQVAGAVKQAASHEDGMFLGACAAAEAYLRSWREELPFGRPLA